ncbi:MAG TPA: glutamate racemase [Burkholderiales bacterium]|nr:glutamate racemase [Burkholderiales bacterium]
MTKTNPIGVFDSGVGGLSVLREIRNALPHEDLRYVADSGAAPYGDQSSEFIISRAQAVVEFFVKAQVKAIVVACNTATAVAVQSLRSRCTIAIVAIEPAVKPAAERTRSGVIGILATNQTLASERFAHLTQEYGKDVKILAQPCPGLVEQVERASLDGPRTEALIAQYVVPLLEQGADTLVLGCTHYPFLISAIRAVAGPAVSIMDPAAAVARELHRRLKSNNLLSCRNTCGTEQFWTSGSPTQVQPVVEALWGSAVEVHALPAPRY